MRTTLESREDRTIQEILNGEKGGQNGTEADYSTIPEPEYDSVDSEMFDYLEHYDESQ